MARIRNLKPDFWTDEKLVELEVWERLLFIGLWNFADDQGYMPYSPKRIKMQVFPADSLDVSRGLQSLISIGALTLYDSESGQVLHVTNWSKHQKVSNPSRSKYDEMDLTLADTEPEKPRKHAEFTPEIPEPYANPPESSRGLHKEREGEKEVEREREGERGSLVALRNYSHQANNEISPREKINTGSRIVNEFLATIPDVKFPAKIRNELTAHTTASIKDGIHPTHITRGLQLWNDAGYPASTLPNSIVQAQREANGAPTPGTPRPRRATGTERAIAALAIDTSSIGEHP
ncbi:hypothetical protein ACQCSX_04245 [Pseudarthrobacter sp. P1]|uniref:hypothetical protein n=1 Tax=Pseudarthrobacter sp. P1 TaxID=3418418 RepID=UPI003CF6167A